MLDLYFEVLLEGSLQFLLYLTPLSLQLLLQASLALSDPLPFILLLFLLCTFLDLGPLMPLFNDLRGKFVQHMAFVGPADQ